jgi:hypothetical protein
MMEITDNQANPFDGPGLVRRAVADTKKPALRLACLVDQTLRISNLSFIEGLVQLQSFIEACQSFVPAPE